MPGTGLCCALAWVVSVHSHNCLKVAARKPQGPGLRSHSWKVAEHTDGEQGAASHLMVEEGSTWTVPTGFLLLRKQRQKCLQESFQLCAKHHVEERRSFQNDTRDYVGWWVWIIPVLHLLSYIF